MKIRIALVIAATCAALVLSGAASASGANGVAWLSARNTTDRTVLISNTVFHLGTHTQIRGLNGEHMTLDELIWVPNVESYDGFDDGARTLFVEFDATLVGTQYVLNWIQLSADKEGMDRTKMPASLDRNARSRGGR